MRAIIPDARPPAPLAHFKIKIAIITSKRHYISTIPQKIGDFVQKNWFSLFFIFTGFHFLASVTRIGLPTGGSFIVKCNLSFCLQPKLVNEKGETPLHEAAIAGNPQRVKSLLEKV